MLELSKKDSNTFNFMREHNRLPLNEMLSYDKVGRRFLASLIKGSLASEGKDKSCGKRAKKWETAQRKTASSSVKQFSSFLE